jgi:hypothetical protein
MKFILIFLIAFSFEQTSKLLEKTLKKVESLIPNKCENVFNRYKQQLEIEKYENLMQNILQSFNKGKLLQILIIYLNDSLI